MLVVCPDCDRLAVICDEEHSTFFDPRQLLAHGAEPEDAICPGCRCRYANTFELASTDRIRAEGFTPADYE